MYVEQMRTRFPPAVTQAFFYGLVGFGTGFVFGAIRQLLLAPNLGDEASRWMEFPFVTLAIAWLGWWLGARKAGSAGTALLIGIGGLTCLLVIENVFALQMLSMTLDDYLATFDIFRGALFPYGLAAMAIAPWLGWRLGR